MRYFLILILSLVVAVNTAHADSSSGQSLYGWLDRVNYTQGRSPWTEGLGLKDSGSYINISVFGITTRLTREIKCNTVFLDSTLPQIGGISIGDLSGKSAREMDQAFVTHRGKFIRLNNVQVHMNRNQKICVTSSAEVVTDIPKTEVEFPEVNNQYLRRVYDVAVRAGIGELDSYTHLKPAGKHSASTGPADYDCNRFQWTSAEAAQLLADNFQKNELYGLKVAKLELSGVRARFDKTGVCEFDAMNIVASSK